LICEGGVCIAGSACDVCKNTPAGFVLKMTKRYGPLFLHRKTDSNARLHKSPTWRVLDTFDRSKVSGENTVK